MQQYTTFTITEQGLLIQLTEAGKEYVAEIKENNKERLAEGSDYDYSLWWDLNEYNFCNGYCDIPDQHKGLTSAPMISDQIIDDEITQLEYDYANVWAFMDYQVRSELGELIEKGEVLFPWVSKDKPLPNTPEEIEQDHVVSYANQNKMPLDGQADFNRCRQALFNHVHRIEPGEGEGSNVYAQLDAAQDEIERLQDKILDMEQVISELNAQIAGTTQNRQLGASQFIAEHQIKQAIFTGNTIKNPLVIERRNTIYDPIVLNKGGEQSGEYVDKSLAEELLEQLKNMLFAFSASSESEIQRKAVEYARKTVNKHE